MNMQFTSLNDLLLCRDVHFLATSYNVRVYFGDVHFSVLPRAKSDNSILDAVLIGKCDNVAEKGFYRGA